MNAQPFRPPSPQVRETGTVVCKLIPDRYFVWGELISNCSTQEDQGHRQQKNTKETTTPRKKEDREVNLQMRAVPLLRYDLERVLRDMVSWIGLPQSPRPGIETAHSLPTPSFQVILLAACLAWGGSLPAEPCLLVSLSWILTWQGKATHPKKEIHTNFGVWRAAGSRSKQMSEGA